MGSDVRKAGEELKLDETWRLQPGTLIDLLWAMVVIAKGKKVDREKSLRQAPLICRGDFLSH